jgi:transglutaminase-like putative cysteine protease
LTIVNGCNYTPDIKPPEFKERGEMPMKFQAPEGMQEYVSPTVFCDSDNVEIKKMAEEITRDASSPKDAAMKIFFYVRDIPYAVTTLNRKASRTLKENRGFCVTKTNLQVALLRATGIPARYHQVVLDKKVIKEIVSDFLYNKHEETIWYHPWCECYLSGRWIACDSYLDKALYGAAIKEGIITREQMPTIDWDGESDLKTALPWVLKDAGVHSSYDEVFEDVMKKTPVPAFIMSFVCTLSNRYTEKLRKKA